MTVAATDLAAVLDEQRRVIARRAFEEEERRRRESGGDAVRAAAAALLGMREREVLHVQRCPHGTVIVTFDGAAVIVVDEATPDGVGQVGLTAFEPRGQHPQVPVFTPPDPGAVWLRELRSRLSQLAAA